MSQPSCGVLCLLSSSSIWAKLSFILTCWMSSWKKRKAKKRSARADAINTRPPIKPEVDIKLSGAVKLALFVSCGSGFVPLKPQKKIQFQQLLLWLFQFQQQQRQQRQKQQPTPLKALSFITCALAREAQAKTPPKCRSSNLLLLLDY